MLEIQGKSKKAAVLGKEDARVGLGEEGHFDTDIYELKSSKFAGYVTSIAATDEQDVRDDLLTSGVVSQKFRTVLRGTIVNYVIFISC